MEYPENVREEAKAYLAMGISGLIQLHGIDPETHGCTCNGPPASRHGSGKHPKVPKGGKRDDALLTTVEQIDALTGYWNLGLLMGSASGICNIDLDEGINIADARDALDEAGINYFTTGRKGGGLHIPFRITGGPVRTLKLKTPEGKDVGSLLGDGSLTVVPPSAHSQGGYSYVLGSSITSNYPAMETVDASQAVEYVLYICRVIGLTIAPPGERTYAGGADDEDNNPLDEHELDDLPGDVPSVACGNVRDLRTLLSGTITIAKDAATDRSSTLYGYACGIVDAVRYCKLDPMDYAEIIAGVIKAIDLRSFDPPWMVENGRMRGDASWRYRETVLKAIHAPIKEAVEKKAAVGASADDEDDYIVGDDSIVATPQKNYDWWDGVLRYTKQKARPPVADGKLEILADLLTMPDMKHVWIVRCTLEHRAEDGSVTEEVIDITVQDVDQTERRFGDVVSRMLGAKFNVYPKMGHHLRAAALAFSPNIQYGIANREMGWTEINGKNYYLLPGMDGAIGPHGVEPSIRMNMELLGRNDWLKQPSFSSYGKGVRPSSGPEERAEGWNALRTLVEAGTPEKTFPVVLWAVGGPLYRLGMNARCILHIVGSTGVRKTAFALAALGMQRPYDGPSTTAPVSWSSTGTSIQLQLHHAKDVSILVDDYKGAFNKDALTSVIQAYGDRIARQRSKVDQTAQEQQQPRGMFISTGENELTEQGSTESRVHTIKVDADDYPLIGVIAAQYAGPMLRIFNGDWIQWLAARVSVQNRSELRELTSDTAKKLRLPGVHDRLVDNAAAFVTIARLLRRYAEETQPTMVPVLKRWIDTLVISLQREMRERQDSITQKSAGHRFLRALRDHVRAGNVWIRHRNTGLNLATRWGLLLPDGTTLLEPTPRGFLPGPIAEWDDVDGGRLLFSQVTWDAVERVRGLNLEDVNPQEIRRSLVEQWGAEPIIAKRRPLDDTGEPVKGRDRRVNGRYLTLPLTALEED